MTDDYRYGEVGYENENGLINLGLASKQPSGPWRYVMHCPRCHSNCGAYAGVITETRRCPHCDCNPPLGEQDSVPLPEADLVRRCGAEACRSLGLEDVP